MALPFINLQNSVEVSPQAFSTKTLNSVLTFCALGMFGAAAEHDGNKKTSYDPMSSSSPPAIHPPPSFIFNFSLFIVGELSLLSGPREQGPAMNEGTAV